MLVLFGALAEYRPSLLRQVFDDEMTNKINFLSDLTSRLRGLPPSKHLSLFLWVVALHSMVVGLFLVIQPSAFIRLAGFNKIHEPFFPCQGGVFHIIMAIAYIYGAIDIHQNNNMIIYAIIVKMAATIFLFSYFFFIQSLWIIFVSGIIDFFMGTSIWVLLGSASVSSKAREMTPL